MQGFPSYLGLPVNYPILNHATGLTRYRASRYLARLPTRYAESGSLSLCAVHFLSLPSDPAVTSNALAIRIDFPLVGATPVSFNRPGLPATLGKPKTGATDTNLSPLPPSSAYPKTPRQMNYLAASDEVSKAHNLCSQHNCPGGHKKDAKKALLLAEGNSFA